MNGTGTFYEDPPGITRTHGGGIFINQSSPTLKSCIFTANSDFYGGGGFVNHGSPAVQKCTFKDHSASRGGARLYGCTVTVSGCDFIENSAKKGGGIADPWDFASNPVPIEIVP
ncbi:MAG: hypothetical protein ABIK28_19830 [Planctomycetota bacterium]